MLGSCFYWWGAITVPQVDLGEGGRPAILAIKPGWGLLPGLQWEMSKGGYKPRGGSGGGTWPSVPAGTCGFRVSHSSNEISTPPTFQSALWTLLQPKVSRGSF